MSNGFMKCFGDLMDSSWVWCKLQISLDWEFYTSWGKEQDNEQAALWQWGGPVETHSCYSLREVSEFKILWLQNDPGVRTTTYLCLPDKHSLCCSCYLFQVSLGLICVLVINKLTCSSLARCYMLACVENTVNSWESRACYTLAWLKSRN